MIEIWKDIKGYEGLYQVSNLGRVKSFKNNKQMILKTPPDSHGYYKCNLHLNGNKKSFNVHKLVAMAFLNHKPKGHKIVIDHINGDKLNNKVDNLQLISNRQNTSKDRKGGSSKYVGVAWYKPLNKWRVHIRIDGRVKHLGYFIDELAAAKAYQNELKSLS